MVAPKKAAKKPTYPRMVIIKKKKDYDIEYRRGPTLQ